MELSFEIRLLRRNFFRFWVGNQSGWIRGPSGEWVEKYEPMSSWVGLECPTAIRLRSVTLTTLPWLQQITKPIISRGPEEASTKNKRYLDLLLSLKTHTIYTSWQA